jgi:hypothetical protein
MQATGLSERVVRDALDRMHGDGLLVCEVRGKPDPAKRRASLYRLPDPGAIHIPVPVNGSMGPPPQVYGTSEVDGVGTCEQVYGTSDTTEDEDAMVTLTIRAADPNKLAAAIRALGRDVEVIGHSEHDLEQADERNLDNVRPLRGRHAS